MLLPLLGAFTFADVLHLRNKVFGLAELILHHRHRKHCRNNAAISMEITVFHHVTIRFAAQHFGQVAEVGL